MLNCKKIKSIVPNSLSIVRIFLAFVFLFCVINQYNGLALFSFVIAALTDFLDGYLARLWNVESTLGSIIDPLADKCLMITSYAILGLSEISQTDLTVPFYLSVIVIVRDICIMFTVSLCKFFQISLQFKPLFSSKINTTIQLIYVVFLLFCRYFSTVMSLIPLVAVIIKIAGSLVAASTLFSAIDYLKHYFWIYDEIKNAIHKEQK